MVSIQLKDFEKNKSFQAVSLDGFPGVHTKTVSEDSPYFQFLQPFFDQLSYIYSQEEDRKKTGFRITRYIGMLNKQNQEVFACLSRGMIVASELMHLPTTVANLNLEFSDEVEKKTNIIGYLYNKIALEGHSESVKNKIIHIRNLFTQMICGMKHLEDISLLNSKQKNKVESLEDVLKSKFSKTCQLVCFVYDIQINSTHTRHGNFFLSDVENKRHFLIDMNFPIIQFKTKEDLINFAPKFVRTFFAQTNEISQQEMTLLGFRKNIYQIKREEVVIDKVITFQKVPYKIEKLNRMKEIVGYSKSVWNLPYETSSPILEDGFWKIKIQRLIYLVSYTIQFHKIFHPPFMLSPLTDEGVKAKIVHEISDDPVSLAKEDYPGKVLIEKLKTQVEQLKTKANTERLNLLQEVLSILKIQFGEMLSITESGKEVRQFRFGDDCLAGVKIPLL